MIRILVLLLVFISCSNTEEVKKKWTLPQNKNWKEIRVKLDIISNSILDLDISKGYFLKGEKREDFISNLRIHTSFLKENERIIIYPENKKFVYKNREYRGNLELVNREGLVYIINILDLEEYLLSVVPSEMPATWHTEALKAQAIAARTYALYHIIYPKYLDYHLEADVNSQMYTGTSKEHPNSTLAVQETKGMILIHGENLVQAFYHSNSGGITESPEEIWGYKLDYMKPIFSEYCINSEKFNWEYKINSNQLEKILDLDIGDIQDISVKEITISGRVKSLVFKGTKAQKEILGKDFRSTVGATKIKSLLFEISKVEDYFQFKGRGFGHGVGMSQWGSYNMAKNNKTYEEILKFYYNGVEISKIEN